MSEGKIDKKKIYKDLIEISPIVDPKVITRLTVNIDDIERTLAMCDKNMDWEVRKLLITYLKVTKKLEEQEKE